MGSKKEKILMVSCDGLGNGGVQAVIMNVARNLTKTYTFDIVVFTKEKRLHELEFKELGGKIFRIPKLAETKFPLKRLDYYFRGVYIYCSLLKILKKNGPYAAIHCHNAFESGICLKAAKKVGIPVRISHVHMVHTKEHFLRNVYDRKYLGLINRYATHKIGCSAEACQSYFGREARTKVVNNPYDSIRFDPKKYNFKVSNSPIISQIGYFSENKNQLFSLDVVAKIKEEYPNVKLNLIGFDVGGHLCVIENRIKELNLISNVTIHPSNADTPEILSGSNAFLFPSKKEGFGIVLIEAQAMGVPCYASDSIPQNTDCGGCIFLPLGKGASFWAERIICDFKNSGKDRKTYNCEEFSLSRVMEQYNKLYRGEQW
ncbi:MAG: glycosyltransferase [Clostridia bacterium]|nr:glycosyltransferase [Clostridia bacterium]